MGDGALSLRQAASVGCPSCSQPCACQNLPLPHTRSAHAQLRVFTGPFIPASLPPAAENPSHDWRF